MSQLTSRQHHILQFIRANGATSNTAIRDHLTTIGHTVSRATTVRDIEALLDGNHITRTGAGRGAKYHVSDPTWIDPDHYFEQGPDEREVIDRFKFDVLTQLDTVFTDSELAKLDALTHTYQTNIRQILPEVYKKEIERLTIELSWKSSQIEGNTYTLLDTEILIRDQQEATGHTRDEAIMILNHKRALDYIFSDMSAYATLSIRHLEELHQLLVDQLGVSIGLRSTIVSITGTRYRPLDNQPQIREALLAMITHISHYKDPYHKALLVLAMVSYIQPFLNGNKRTARLAANAVLGAHGGCFLSYRSIDTIAYKKAMLLFYEQNSLSYLKELFIAQYEFSTTNYFLTH